MYNIWEERVRALFSQFCTLLVCIFQRVLEWLRGKDGGFEVRPPGGFSAWQFYFFSCLYLNICLFAAPAPKTPSTSPAMSDSLFFQLFFLRPAFLAIAELSEQWKLKIWPSLAQGDLHVNLWSAAWEFPACTEYTHWYHIIDITMDVAECFFWVGGR